MDAFLAKWHFLKSRKFWTMIGAVVTLLVTASNQDPYPIDTVIQGLVAIVLGYMGTVAWEDTASKKAIGEIAKAESDAQTTTVSTPGESDVTVTAPADATPAQPVIHHTGLR